MKKSTEIGIGLAVLLVLSAGAAVLLYVTRIDAMIARRVEAHFERQTGTEVSVGGVDLLVGETRGTITGFTIANPPGYETPFALEIGQVTMVVDPISFTTDLPIVREIVVSGATLHAEQQGERANVTDILEHVRATAVSEPEPDAIEGRIVIERFALPDARIVVHTASLEEPETLMLEPVVLDGIGGEAGASYSDATDQVLTAIFRAARDAMRDRLRSAAGSAIREEAEEALRERLDELRQ